MCTRIAVLLMLAAPVYAQAPATPPQIRAYDWIIGRWQCKGFTSTGKPEYTFSQQIERPPETNWFRFHSTAGSGRVDPQLSTETAFQTFDSAAHLWRYFAFYNSGAYAVGTASDFVGNKQSWTGVTYENGRQKSWGRIVFIKISATEKREEFYDIQNGKQKPAGNEVCTKVE
jgi:hypothetical protein